MANATYEVAFYIGKRLSSLPIRKFNNLAEALQNLIASMGTYIESVSFMLNVDSSYCVTVWDLHSDKMIQLLGPIDANAKRLINDAFIAANKVPFTR